MSPTEAAKLLDLPADATPEQLETRFLDLRRKLEDKIAKAPTPGLQAKYRDTLAQITTAFETLTLAADSSSLPVLNKPSAVSTQSSALSGGGPATAGPSREASAKPAAKKSGSGREFILVAFVAIAVLAGGAWWIVKERAEKAEQARVAAQLAADAAAEAQRVKLAEEARLAADAKAASQLRTQLATAKVVWDALENRLHEAERHTSEAKSELRGFRDGPAWKKAELSALAKRHELFSSWLNGYLVSHPAKVHRATAEQLLSDKRVEEAAEEVALMQQEIDGAQETLRWKHRSLLEITTRVDIASQPQGVKFFFTDSYGRVTEGVTPATLNDQQLSHVDNPNFQEGDAGPSDTIQVGEFTVIPSVRFARPGWADATDTHPIENLGDSPNEFSATFPEGGLKVQSVPEGVPFVATNPLGWKATGQTPATLQQVPPGTVEVRLTRSGYADVAQKVTVVAKQTASTSLLDQRPQTLTITVAETKSKIFVDGKFAGYEKAVLTDLTPTEHQLQIEAPNYTPYRTKFSVKQENTRASLSFRFADLATRNIACSECGGNGYKTHRHNCNTCRGTGWVRCSNCNGNGTVPFLNSYITCKECNRIGQVPCSDCQQTGVVDDRETCNQCSGRGYFSKLDLQ